MKLVLDEAETSALRVWLGDRAEEPHVTSALGRVEVLRAGHRAGERALTAARALVRDLDLVPLDRAVQDLAGELGDPLLRTLDALHLASALILGDALTAFVAYDRRLVSAAVAAGLVTAAPGAA